MIDDRIINAPYGLSAWGFMYKFTVEFSGKISSNTPNNYLISKTGTATTLTLKPEVKGNRHERRKAKKQNR